jgi:hypothetical protein
MKQQGRKLYRLADYVPGYPLATDLRAQETGEKRPPQKGEWYLSGAVVEAYRAKNNLSQAYYIVRIVRVKTVTYETVVERMEL